MMRFLLRLVSPRPTFPMDMTDSERRVMQEHVVYWTALRDKGIAIVFGPVLDPKGVWGVAVVETSDEANARALLVNDPVEKAGLGRIEIYPMGPGTIVRK
ncbi:hypothetical protein AUF78_13180 [archaeon 13_1_20CM_2_51_12]|nr:MAG: hypothetical protein AUF78_13180 [archaeon 13_1_20CM_2_51_12]